MQDSPPSAIRSSLASLRRLPYSHDSLFHSGPMPWLRATKVTYPRLRSYASFHTQVAYQTESSSRLPHLTSDGSAHMVNVSDKPITPRRAIAVGRVAFSSPETSTLIRRALIRKGDVLGTARLAGIMAAKNCPSLIPLCHPIVISGVNVDVKLDDEHGDENHRDKGGVLVRSEVSCVGQTGVEMEALTSVTGALLTVIDMVKSVDRGARIEEVRLVLKEGGRSGLWKDKEWVMKEAV
jgi:molybdenum cofactor biosynthesis protein MoaC